MAPISKELSGGTGACALDRGSQGVAPISNKHSDEVGTVFWSRLEYVLAIFAWGCRGELGLSSAAMRSMESVTFEAASFVLLWEAIVLTRFLRAACSRTGAGAHGLTMEMSRGGGGCLAGGRLRVAALANLGLSVESRAILVVGLPWSSYTVVEKLFAICVTLASCASECWDRAAALVSTASAFLSIL